jgi:hypothetical protein
VREAKKIRNAIFQSWARALRRGEIVETPLGEMQVVRAPKRYLRINRVNPKPQIVAVNSRARHIVFRPWPGLVETLPTTFYQEADAALLEKLGRTPWATSDEQHQENIQAIKAAIAARPVPAPPPAEDFRKAMSPAQIAARAQRPLSDFFPPPPPPGRRWGR